MSPFPFPSMTVILGDEPAQAHCPAPAQRLSLRPGIAVLHTSGSFRGDTLMRHSVLGVVPAPPPQRGTPFAPRGAEGSSPASTLPSGRCDSLPSISPFVSCSLRNRRVIIHLVCVIPAHGAGGLLMATIPSIEAEAGDALGSAAAAAVRPCLDSIITEDETPVDNVFSEKQQRLLTEPLYSSWDAGRKFMAMANVGLFYAVRQPPLVPDVLLSLDVEITGDWLAKEHRSYFVWEFGKAPEAVVEIVSNSEGGETRERNAQVCADRHRLLCHLRSRLRRAVRSLERFCAAREKLRAVLAWMAAGPGVGANALAGAVRELRSTVAALVRSPRSSRPNRRREHRAGTRCARPRTRSRGTACRPVTRAGVTPDER